MLDDVSFSIGAGEAYGLVGESGCGKTTVAMSLMRYLPDNAEVEAGRIMFGDEDVLTATGATLRKWRGDRMAMVYQDPGTALNPSIKVGEQIAEVYRFHKGMGRSEALAAAVEMLSTVQISAPDRVVRRYPHELSGGQQQRIMFAMALATDPDLLVLDEPTTGLDATVEAEVLDLVEQLRTQFDASILFVSHNLGIVARMCERVGVLYAGRLIEEGPAGELFQNPRHPVHAGAPALHAAHGDAQGRRPARPDPRLAAADRRRDRRLRVRRPLPDRARPLPGGASADRAGGGRGTAPAASTTRRCRRSRLASRPAEEEAAQADGRRAASF